MREIAHVQDELLRQAAIQAPSVLELADKESGWIMLYQPYEAYAMRDDIEWRIPTAQRPYELTFRAGQIAVNSQQKQARAR